MSLLLSVFTPTHDPAYLSEAYDSLKVQTHDNWEWVLATNGKAVDNLPEEITKDPRVKVFPFPLPEEQDKDERGKPPNIGALKRFACDNSQGEVFVELDHDDLLVPGILESVAKEVNAGAGFVYSDAAVFLPSQDNMPIGYSEKHGYETYEFRVYGKTFLATRNFEITPRSLCEVYYAPDHIRCWTRQAYYKAGGHDKELMVGDDHDLVCRTYLQQIPFAHTGTCGYLYRNHPGNTVKSHGEEIQKIQNKTRDLYIYQLMDQWCKLHGYEYLDLSLDSKEWVTPKDRYPLKLNLKDDSVGAIRAYNFFQHISQDSMVHIMNELYRVLIPGGFLCISCPSTTGQGAFAPHYKSYWNPHTFEYFTDRKKAEELDGVTCRFQKVRCFNSFPDDAHKQADLAYVYADLSALKGQRQPGLVRI